MDKKKRMDHMVDHQRFWTFLVMEMGVRNDEMYVSLRCFGSSLICAVFRDWHNMNEAEDSVTGQREESDDSSTSSDDGLHRTESVFEVTRKQRAKGSTSRGRKKGKGDMKVFNFERSNRIFDFMESQNGLWITMRQIHVYLLWLYEKLQGLEFDWDKYQFGELAEERIDEKTFKTLILEAANNGEAVRQSVLEVQVDHAKISTEINLAEQYKEDANEFGPRSDEEDDEKYSTQNEKARSRKELNRLRKHIWINGDDKLFSQQLSWIFKQCAMSDVSTDDLSSWQNICQFIKVFREGSLEDRIRHDLKFLGGNHQVYRDEFEQFKATLKCRGETAKSLFYQIRSFNESINWLVCLSVERRNY